MRPTFHAPIGVNKRYVYLQGKDPIQRSQFAVAIAAKLGIGVQFIIQHLVLQANV